MTRAFIMKLYLSSWQENPSWLARCLNGCMNRWSITHNSSEHLRCFLHFDLILDSWRPVLIIQPPVKEDLVTNAKILAPSKCYPAARNNWLQVFPLANAAPHVPHLPSLILNLQNHCMASTLELREMGELVGWDWHSLPDIGLGEFLWED